MASFTKDTWRIYRKGPKNTYEVVETIESSDLDKVEKKFEEVCLADRGTPYVLVRGKIYDSSYQEE